MLDSNTSSRVFQSKVASLAKEEPLNGRGRTQLPSLRPDYAQVKLSLYPLLFPPIVAIADFLLLVWTTPVSEEAFGRAVKDRQQDSRRMQI